MAAERKAKLHCWEDGPPTEDDGMSTTCMRTRGHRGPHQWTRDDHIGVTLAPVVDPSETLPSGENVPDVP